MGGDIYLLLRFSSRVDRHGQRRAMAVITPEIGRFFPGPMAASA